MAAHLAHKIQWGSLTETFIARSDVSWRREMSPAQNKKVTHVGRVLAHMLQEFQSTCKTTPEELAVLDVKTWRISEQSYGGYTGYYDSLLWGYIELNMLLAEPHRIRPLLHNSHDECSNVLQTLLGLNDGGHPQSIADKLAPAFDDESLKPLTADVMQTLRDHAALLFRCMYIMTGENKLLDEPQVVSIIRRYFGCDSPE